MYMSLHNQGSWWRGSAAAKDLSEVGGDAVLLFLIPSQDDGAAHYGGGRGGGKRGVGLNCKESK